MAAFRRALVRLLQTTRLNRVVHRLYYRHIHGFESATAQLAAAVDHCVALAHRQGLLDQGDYCEFGVFKGANLWHVQNHVAAHYATAMRFFGFDSFQGLPDVTGPDQTRYGEFYRGQYACSLALVRHMMDQAGTDWSRTFLIEGFFRDSLTDAMAQQYDLHQIAIAVVDCDLYASTAEVLAFLSPRLCPDAIVVMDDWGCFRGDAQRGQQRALHEFLAQAPQWSAQPLLRYGSWGQVFQFHHQSAAAHQPDPPIVTNLAA